MAMAAQQFEAIGTPMAMRIAAAARNDPRSFALMAQQFGGTAKLFEIAAGRADVETSQRQARMIGGAMLGQLAGAPAGGPTTPTPAPSGGIQLPTAAQGAPGLQAVLQAGLASGVDLDQLFNLVTAQAALTKQAGGTAGAQVALDPRDFGVIPNNMTGDSVNRFMESIVGKGIVDYRIPVPRDDISFNDLRRSGWSQGMETFKLPVTNPETGEITGYKIEQHPIPGNPRGELHVMHAKLMAAQMNIAMARAQGKTNEDIEKADAEAAKAGLPRPYTYTGSIAQDEAMLGWVQKRPSDDEIARTVDIFNQAYGGRRPVE
jgi:hypothetical protein